MSRIEFIGSITQEDLARADKSTIEMIKSQALVRCRDCTHSDSAGISVPNSTYCMEHRRYMDTDGFCSLGGRRTSV